MRHPLITITCTFTRDWAVDRWIECLDKAVHNPELTSLVFVVDCQDATIMYRLKQYAKTKPYRSVDIVMNEDNAPSEINIAQRRQRIAYVKNQTKAFVAHTECDYVIGLEDDTVFEPDQLLTLLEPFLMGAFNDKLGFVEGVQCGRWGVKIIGAWLVNDFINPTEAHTIMPPKPHPDNPRIIHQIHGGGFYGYATPKHLYVEHEYYSASTQPYGPDVNYGLWLKQRGYQCVIDWGVIFGHNNRDVIILPDEKVASAEFNKNPATGHWDRRDTER